MGSFTQKSTLEDENDSSQVENGKKMVLREETWDPFGYKSQIH